MSFPDPSKDPSERQGTSSCVTSQGFASVGAVNEENEGKPIPLSTPGPLPPPGLALHGIAPPPVGNGSAIRVVDVILDFEEPSPRVGVRMDTTSTYIPVPSRPTTVDPERRRRLVELTKEAFPNGVPKYWKDDPLVPYNLPIKRIKNTSAIAVLKRTSSMDDQHPKWTVSAAGRSSTLTTIYPCCTSRIPLYRRARNRGQEGSQPPL
ncbi:hypothetical protein DFH06DRAFT_1134783 [Mycena polygramma]|nr:hypothetical protein DFH06DRAFT_1134783 [Mycena polygramma]